MKCLVREASRILAAVLTACALSAANAQQPVRLLVGYPPGGPVDAAARLLAPSLAREIGGTVLVENRPGANATVAGDQVARATPDGALFFFAASPTITISPNVMRKMPFDPARDLTPVAPLVSYYNVLVVNRDTPLRSIDDLIRHAKANPGKVFYGSAGNGASNHLAGELFAVQTDTKLTHVPYKGNAQSMTDVIGGQITMMFDIISNSRGFIAGGKVRALAVTSPQRNASLPDVPTMREAGLPGYDVGGWFGVYGPARLPAPIVTRFADAWTKVLADPELRARLVEQGYEVWSGPPQALAERAAKERTLWATVTKGIEVD